jgi:hypothetical protein
MEIAGTGLVCWTFDTTTGVHLPVKTMAYYVPDAKVRLLSPQRVFDLEENKGGSYYGNHCGLHLTIQNHLIFILYDVQNSLPIGYTTVYTSSPQANLLLHHVNNQNLILGQQILLHWHHRFGHLNLLAAQQILRHSPFVSAKYSTASKCDLHTLRCATCEFAKGHLRSVRAASHSGPSIPSDLDGTIGALKINHLKPGAQVSVDHFESRVLGRTFDSFGKVTSDTYKGGCIFVDHSSGYVHVEHQVGFSAIETIRAKQEFERYSVSVGVYIESYLTDSGTFKATSFVQHIKNHNQRIHYCGANAHHKNGVAERAVRSISNMARALLLHASSHWKNGIDATLWPMAVKYAVHLFNCLPNDQQLCPADLFTGGLVPRHRLLSLHVWGCPIYVLDPRLQAGQKIPRWQPRSRQGIFVGFSTLHSSEVPLVLNLQTGSITPQFHVVFDDYFSTVLSISPTEDPPNFWSDLCLEHSLHIHTDAIDSDNTVDSFIYLNDEWLTNNELCAKQRASLRHSLIQQSFVPPHSPRTDVPLTSSLPLETDSGPDASSTSTSSVGSTSSRESSPHPPREQDINPGETLSPSRETN